MIAVFGLEAGGALVYLLYKKAGYLVSLGRKAATVSRAIFGQRKSISYALAIEELPAPEPHGNAAADLARVKTLLEQISEKLSKVDTKVEDSNLKIDGVSANVTAASTKIDEANIKIDDVKSSVSSIRVQLDKAGHVAVFWNVSSLLFGVAGVVIGILAL